MIAHSYHITMLQRYETEYRKEKLTALYNYDNN